MKKCCYFKSTGTWSFGLICVLAQPSYSDKIYDLTFFSKSDRINLGSGLTLTAALSTAAPHTGLWIPSRFNTKSIPWVCQQHSSYFFFFFFFLGEGWLCLILSMVASLEILKGNFYLQKTKARQSNSKTQELKSYQKVCSHSCILYKTAMHLLKVNPN